MIILQDTREKNPLSFDIYNDVEVEVCKLDYGDYMIKGVEDLVFERKASTQELYTNLTVDKKRFYRELDVLKNFVHPYILLEFPQSNMYSFPSGSGIPKKRWKYLAGGRKTHKSLAAYMRKCLYEIEESGISVLYMDNSENMEKFIVSTGMKHI